MLITWFSVPATSQSGLLDLARRYHLSNQTLERLVHWLAPPDLPAASATRTQQRALAVVVGAPVCRRRSQPSVDGVTDPVVAVGMLVVVNRCTLRLLPVVMAVVALGWLRFMASAYLAGHESHIAGQVGDVGTSVGSNIGDRLAGSEGHQVVVYMRSTASLVFWGLAGIGGLRRVKHHRRDFTLALLAAAPFPLLFMQPYGGEMLLRIYLFSLPFMAFFVAALFVPSPTVGRTWLARVITSIAVLLLLSSFFITRYGNERMDAFTPAEVQAVDYLYEQAPSGSLLLAGTAKTPWKYRDYERHSHQTLADSIDWDWSADLVTDLDEIQATMHGSQYTAAYLIITRSQIANDEMFELLPYPLEDMVTALSASDQFQVLYANEDAIIFILTPPESKGAS